MLVELARWLLQRSVDPDDQSLVTQILDEVQPCHRSLAQERHPIINQIDDDDAELDGYEENSMLVRQVSKSITELNGCTFNLEPLVKQLRQVERELDKALTMASRLRNGLTRPDGSAPEFGLPTVDQVVVWEELHMLETMREQMRAR
ncbi:hypothetical protein [Streptosporangium sp. NPDC004631]